MSTEVICLNHCCGKGVKEVQILCKKLEEKGMKTRQKLAHNDNNLMKKYGVTKDMLKKDQFIIIDSKNICMPASWVKLPLRKQLVENMVNNLTGWQSKIEKK
jgi:dihydroxyacid dehydratase/phosphogluconate dehydratase